MGIWREHFSCVEITKAKIDLFKEPTRYGAASRCHELNKTNPPERWTVISAGNCYVPDYNELTPISFKTALNRHFEAVKDKPCDCLFCRNLNKKVR